MEGSIFVLSRSAVVPPQTASKLGIVVLELLKNVCKRNSLDRFGSFYLIFFLNPSGLGALLLLFREGWRGSSCPGDGVSGAHTLDVQQIIDSFLICCVAQMTLRGSF